MKQLPRTTICTLFEINSPIWNGGQKMVGLNVDRISYHNEIRFKYRRKSDGELSIPDTYYFDGKLSIPDTYYFDGNKYEVNKYKTQQIGNTTLILVPFTDLEVMERI